MRATIALLIGGLSLAGCSTTPIMVACDPFRTQFTSAVPRSPVIAEIQLDVPASGPPVLAAAQVRDDTAAYAALIGQTLPDASPAALQRGEPEGVLALSGGGQWGAFGAGYLDELDKRGAMPRFRMITGVSTGALQALFVGASQAPGTNSQEVLGQLVKEYTIKDEDEVVNRGGYVGAVFRGSVAKLDPLRRKIEAALCSKVPANPQSPDDCPLIKALGQRDAPVVMLGFVEAGSGEMQAVNVSAIARAATDSAAPDRLSMKAAQQCITGGALASVAMPFFYQQVQVTSDTPSRPPARTGTQSNGPDTLTYLDGGVRQSVFLFESLKALAMAEALKGTTTPATARPVYVIRNGPTIAKVDDNADRPRGAIPTAERGYSLIVNQSEVTAIEAIRLRNPASAIWLATADGYDVPFDTSDNATGCRKSDDKAMFDPAFMDCLQAFGRAKARDYKGRPNGWIILPKPEGAAPD